MTTYEPAATPRIAAAFAAVALSVATLAAMVAVPAAHEPAADAVVLARATAPTEVTISPARIDVIAIRAPNVAWAMPDDGKPNCKPEV
ncbi:MAG: hypothetical protein U1F48_04910 [Burkholderiales bacterium]